MLHLLEPASYASAAALFAPLYHHLSIVAILNGDAPGSIWVDQPDNPQSALAKVEERFFLAGSDQNQEFNAAVRSYFLDELYPMARSNGKVAFGLYYPAPGWELAIAHILEGKYPNLDMRHYYCLNGGVAPTWRERVPDGFRVQQIDRLLLSEELENIEAMRRETSSECPSPDYFLENRFGFCLRTDTKVAGWCMSEYNSGARCEIGIETVAEFQKHGFAVLTASALIEYAYTHGITSVGWHCWASNTPSIRTALRLGFEKVCEFPEIYAWFDECANLAVHANRSFNQGQPAESLAWFERALQAGQPPLWSFVVAAFAYTRQGEKSQALACLRRALDGGFDGLDWIRGSEHLQDLHGTSEWRAWLG